MRAPVVSSMERFSSLVLGSVHFTLPRGPSSLAFTARVKLFLPQKFRVCSVTASLKSSFTKNSMPNVAA